MLAVEKYTTCSSTAGSVAASMAFTATTFTCRARSGSPQAVAVWMMRVAEAIWARWGSTSRRSPTSRVMRGSWRGTAVSFSGSRSHSSSWASVSR
jgi:hypothetical protein